MEKLEILDSITVDLREGLDVFDLLDSLSSINKFSTVLRKLRNTELKTFLQATGNQDIKTAVKILTEDLIPGETSDAEIIQALTLLKRGRETFVSLIEKEYASIFSNNASKLREYYFAASIASQTIAFCYKLLQKKQQTRKALSESKKYFYSYLYHHSITMNPSSFKEDRSGLTFSVDSTYTYKQCQDEEKAFLRVAKDIFDESLPLTISDDYEIDEHVLGQQSVARIRTSITLRDWEPPLWTD